MLSDAKRFLSPLLDFKWATFKNSFDALWMALFGFANVVLVTNVMKAIENNDAKLFHRWLFVFLGYIVVFWIVQISLRKWGFVTFRHTIMRYLYGKYSRELFQFENGVFELIGTGKIASTFDKGVSQWMRLLHSLVRNATYIAVA